MDFASWRDFERRGLLVHQLLEGFAQGPERLVDLIADPFGVGPSPFDGSGAVAV